MIVRSQEQDYRVTEGLEVLGGRRSRAPVPEKHIEVPAALAEAWQQVGRGDPMPILIGQDVAVSRLNEESGVHVAFCPSHSYRQVSGVPFAELHRRSILEIEGPILVCHAPDPRMLREGDDVGRFAALFGVVPVADDPHKVRIGVVGWMRQSRLWRFTRFTPIPPADYIDRIAA